MIKEFNLTTFVPDRFVGGDDPVAAIQALTNLNAKLTDKVERLSTHLNKLWQPLAALTIEHAGELRVRIADIEAIDPHSQLVISVDPADENLVLIRLTRCDCKHGNDNPDKEPRL